MANMTASIATAKRRRVRSELTWPLERSLRSSRERTTTQDCRSHPPWASASAAPRTRPPQAPSRSPNPRRSRRPFGPSVGTRDEKGARTQGRRPGRAPAPASPSSRRSPPSSVHSSGDPERFTRTEVAACLRSLLTSRVGSFRRRRQSRRTARASRPCFGRTAGFGGQPSWPNSPTRSAGTTVRVNGWRAWNSPSPTI
jgi:hypothetical protein